MMAWQPGSGPFKVARAFPAYNALISYILLFLLCLQTRRFGSVVGYVVCIHWDLGSIPRSPHSSILFCQMLSCADSKMRCTISLTSQRSKRPSMQIQGPNMRTMVLWSQRMRRPPGKVNVAEASMGHNSNNAPSFLAQYPLPLVYSFLFILYFPI